LFFTTAIVAASYAVEPGNAITEVRHVTTSEILSNPDALPTTGLLTTGQPDSAVLDVIAEAGFGAVIDFRGVDEDRGFDEQAEVESRGLRYVSIPVSGSDDISFDNAAILDQVLSETDGPVLLHCKSGNRAAAVLALREKQNGADSESALALGLEAGLTRHRDVVEERLAEE
jgi:uncharacterized protein (TIGR01244 family)